MTMPQPFSAFSSAPFLLAAALSAQQWVARGTPSLATGAFKSAATDPTTGRVHVFDGRNEDWTVRIGAGGNAEWARLPGGGIVATTATIAWDPARGRLTAGAFSPTAVFEWDGTGWAQVSTSLPPNRLAEDRARGILVGILDPDLGTTTRTFELVGVDWVSRGFFGVSARGPLAFDPVRGQVIMHGRDSGGVLRTNAWTGSGWTPVASGSGPDTIEFQLATDFARNRVVALGGLRGVVPVPDTWEWDGTAWTLVTAVGVPAAIRRAMWFDEALQRVCVAGGQLAVTSPPWAASDVWSWDGSAWARHAAVLPAGRADFAVTHDALRGETVLFGGRDGSGARGDTWTWHAGAWQPHALALAPSPRWGHAMAFDPVRGELVLFGGEDGVTSWADQWRWTAGAVWLPVGATTTPPARSFAAMGFDAARDRVVLFGGKDPLGLWLADTWEWDGASWAQRTPTLVPLPLRSPHMAYDVARALVVMQGRHPSTTSTLTETYEWDGVDWIDHGGNYVDPAESIWYDPVRGGVMSTYGTPYVTQWMGNSWAAATTWPIVHGVVLHDSERGLPWSCDGEGVRLLTNTPSTVTEIGVGCGAVGAVPVLTTSVAPLPSAPFGFDLAAAPAASPAMTWVAFAPANVSLGQGCTSWLQGGIALSLAITSAAGNAEWSLPLPRAQWIVGLTIHSQAVVLDAAAPLGFGLTRALRARVGD
ncbi:MAG: hypothetical protein KDC98_13520 [Planctomycetes bacterium]|nr:hypothetical protein [Planctomycetota bacterium]